MAQGCVKINKAQALESLRTRERLSAEHWATRHEASRQEYEVWKTQIHANLEAWLDDFIEKLDAGSKITWPSDYGHTGFAKLGPNDYNPANAYVPNATLAQGIRHLELMAADDNGNIEIRQTNNLWSLL